MRYFLKLAYNGSNYCGWQRQPNAVGVQQVIEEALSTLLRCPTAITGAGRTDAGVHASCMYAHFDTDRPIENAEGLIRSLNHLCGSHIAFYQLIPVEDDAHARFDAVSRTYKYYISEGKTPFMYPYCWQMSAHLDYGKMNEAARKLLMVDDFTSFAKLHSDVKTNICKVSEAYWAPVEHTTPNTDNTRMYVFTITADRFLRNMVRAVVGTLVDVGRGKLSIDGFQQIIEAKDRCAAGNSVPPQALFLNNIIYPYIK
ncbi:MAG: tRNA pseudouridine(38-40) synthase TruA [Muribaculaceae bacterium]|nr:tRNA pseudouridine(38-40) synthase TruA [Muribaculaceae bacterium]